MTISIFKFIGDRTDVAYLQTYYNPLRGLCSLQMGNISSISNKLENLNSHFLMVSVYHYWYQGDLCILKLGANHYTREENKRLKKICKVNRSLAPDYMLDIFPSIRSHTSNYVTRNS
jgi:hypothetical protein